MTMYENANTRFGSAGGPATLTTTERPPMPAVHEAQEYLDKSIAGLCNAVDALESRLGPVLGLPRPSEVSKSPQPPQNVSGRISASGEAVRSVASRITSLLDRLEV